MKPDSTKNKMIQSALDLFHQKGVNATGINEILAASGTGKGQFTHYFKTKEGLVGAVVDYLFQVIRSGKAGTGYDLKTWKDFDRWFQTYIDFQKSVAYSRSCPIGTIGNDLTENQETLRKDVFAFLEWTRTKLTRFFAERKAAGDLVYSTDPDGLADLCISVMQGGMLMTKVRRNPDIFRNASEQVIHYIESLKS